MTAKKKQIRSKRKDEIKVIVSFKDGRKIPDKDFDPSMLTPQQEQYIIKVFEKVFSK